MFYQVQKKKLKIKFEIVEKFENMDEDFERMNFPEQQKKFKKMDIIVSD